MSEPISTVAFIGLGAMGAPMAENLVKRQFRVRGFDMREAARQALAAAGGAAAGSAAAAAEGADALVLMVVNAAQARAVLFEAGALAALAPGASIILMATCPPGEAEAIGAEVVKTGRHFIDAPVSGGVNGARNATLTIMVGAPSDSFARAKPVLDALGDKVFHVGEKAGQGATVKTVNQLLCGVHIAVAAEALSLAEKAGIDGRLLFEIMGGSAASSWMLKDRGPRMQDQEPMVASAVDIFVKDLGIVLDAGRSAKAALPLAAAAHQMFLAASGLGHGARDDSQVVRAYRALNAKPAGDA
ncbi:MULTISPECIES: NAD(P)-dependent oxidoreductase [unclassified Bosea (in: a-proteobacteria)]|uniref:NAD(P)-dependent oxidoreductase n=1 Tax=unclassified Bosea (in: a-proteobacteria) TaxID=2653178 RepID=UPI0009546303|nr:MULTISPECIES: NAD(P)-dependent oxidoreductase [unclassified Bosea (in: a-proteobacteria)]TAJ29701.1 MAG: NAD(P)-dependent oxidoreductase [Bosea sp. (in: a-proteobacteria)]SIQ57845.1 3-hydroxyisobutyrate dehydrogenase [Bosea sp. TND4EK4]